MGRSASVRTTLAPQPVLPCRSVVAVFVGLPVVVMEIIVVDQVSARSHPLREVPPPNVQVRPRGRAVVHGFVVLCGRAARGSKLIARRLAHWNWQGHTLASARGCRPWVFAGGRRQIANLSLVIMPPTTEAHPWWIDWASTPGLFDWISLLLTVGGFVFAYFQFRKTRSATVEATKALTLAQSKLSERAVFAIAPQLSHSREDIQLAMKSGNDREAQRALVRFTNLADEIADVLIDSFASNVVLAGQVQAASARAKKVKYTIVTKPTTNVSTALVPVYKEVDAVVMSVDKLAAGLRNKIEGASNV